MKLSQGITKWGDIAIDTVHLYWLRENKHRMMKFKDLPVGTRFKYPDGSDIWIVVESFKDGLIYKWEGLEVDRVMQSVCCFVDGEEWTLESEVEVLM